MDVQHPLVRILRKDRDKRLAQRKRALPRL